MLQLTGKLGTVEYIKKGIREHPVLHMDFEKLDNSHGHG